MTDQMVQKWVRAFKDGHTNINDVELGVWSSIITKDWVQKFDEKVKDKRHFMMQ